MTIIWCMVPVIWSRTDRKFCYFGLFFAILPFPLLTAQKIKIKIKKSLEISSFYKSVPKIRIICYSVPEIWCMLDVIVIFHFGLFFALLLLQELKKWKFQKMKKTLGNVIILHKCTKNHDHMLYLSWYMVRDRCNFSFWAIFCPFTPVTARKKKIKKKRKKSLQILSFYTCVPKIMIRWCTVLEMWCTTDRGMDRQKKWHIEVVLHLAIKNTSITERWNHTNEICVKSMSHTLEANFP